MTTTTSQSQNSDLQASNSSRAKSIFTSRTVWSIVFTTVAAIAPIVGKDVDQFIKKQDVNYGQDIAQVIVILCGGAATISGRVDAKDPLYTPEWLPGPNKADVDKTS